MEYSRACTGGVVNHIRGIMHPRRAVRGARRRARQYLMALQIDARLDMTPNLYLRLWEMIVFRLRRVRDG